MAEIWHQMVASCTGAFITALFMTPLDVVKIRLQAQTKGFSKGQYFLYCNGLMDHIHVCLNDDKKFGSRRKLWRRLPNQSFNGMLDAFVKITRAEGIKSLWSGLPPTLVMAIPSTVIYYTSYDQLKSRMGFVDGKENSSLIPLLCAAAARSGSVTVITPLELIRTKLQSERMSYNQLGTAIRSAVSSGGMISLWKGWSPMMWRDVPFSAIYFTVYELLKGSTMQYRRTDTVPVYLSFTFGAIGGMIAGVLTLPFDVVKTFRQIELGSSVMNPQKHEVQNRNLIKFPFSTFYILNCLRKEHGIHSWFTGVWPRILKVSPACAIMISSYEYFKKFLNKK